MGWNPPSAAIPSSCRMGRGVLLVGSIESSSCVGHWRFGTVTAMVLERSPNCRRREDSTHNGPSAHPQASDHGPAPAPQPCQALRQRHGAVDRGVRAALRRGARQSDRSDTSPPSRAIGAAERRIDEAGVADGNATYDRTRCRGRVPSRSSRRASFAISPRARSVARPDATWFHALERPVAVCSPPRGRP